MKHLIWITATVFSVLSIQAQTLREIITKTENENFDAAEREFRNLLAKDPNKGEHYFYFGENYFKRGDVDSAEILYNKGVEINPANPLNYAGLGKVLLYQSKVNEAKAQFYKAITLGAGKNPEVLRRVAEAWLVTENKNPDEAITLMNVAIKLDPKTPENYIILGDAFLEKNPADGSTPIKHYKTATSLNPKSTRGILREGKLYQRGRNFDLALEYYNKAISLEPNFAPAFREIAELYFLKGQPSKSIDNWKKYLELNNSDYARYRFMSALYLNKQYPEAIAEYENLKKSNYNSIYLERLAAYSYEEMGDKNDKEAYNKGLDAINRFFEMAGADFKFITSDYKYKGYLLLRTGKDSLGLLAIEKAISMDPSISGDVYGKLAKIAMDAKDYDKVIKYYGKKKNNDFKNLSNTESLDLGKAYYLTGKGLQKEIYEMKDALIKKKKSTDVPEIKQKEARQKELFLNADSAFQRLTQLNPSWPIGYTWRGRANFEIENIQGKVSDSTRTQYEKVIALVKPEERTTSYKSYVLEAYKYLGYYYVSTGDNEKAKEYWLNVREIDPNDPQAKEFLEPRPTKPQGGGKPGLK
jgi:tetratricopeptide (TPR) repeat protein